MKTIQYGGIVSLINKNYEHRTQDQRKFIVQLLKPCFPTLSDKKIRFLTFFLEKVEGPKQISTTDYPLESFVLTQEGNNLAIQTLTRNKIIDVKASSLAIVLPYDKYLNCQVLGETSIEEEVAFMYSSQFLCSMPKKKYLHLLRNSRILAFGESQSVYFQGQQITNQQSGSGIYLVRSGQFRYYRFQHDRQVQTSVFGVGQLFGTLQMMEGDKTKRLMTARCITKSAIVYQFSEQFFKQYIRNYCEHILRQKQRKLMKFVVNADRTVSPDKQFFKSKSSSTNFMQTGTSKLLGLSKGFTTSLNFGDTAQSKVLKGPRSQFPLIDLNNVHKKAISSFREKFQMDSERIEAQGLRKTSFFSLKNEGPLKVYPMVGHRARFTNSEFKDLNRLMDQKQGMISRRKEIDKQSSSIRRGDVLYSFYRQSLYRVMKRSSNNPE